MKRHLLPFPLLLVLFMPVLLPGQGWILTPNPGDPIHITGPTGPQGPAGPVSSVGINFSGMSWLTAGAPVTTAGNITLSPTAAQTPHQVIGTCGAGTTFVPCNLLGGDIAGGTPTFTTVNGLTITTSTGTLTIANLKTITFNNSLTFAGTDSTTMTFPSTSATIARTDAAQTFTGVQTFNSAPTLASITGSTQCLQVNSSGVVSGTGLACGSGGGGGVTFVNHAPQTVSSGSVALTATGSPGAMESWQLNVTTTNIATFTISGQVDGSFQAITLCEPAGGVLTTVNPIGYSLAFATSDDGSSVVCTTNYFKWNSTGSTATTISPASVNVRSSYVAEISAPSVNPASGFERQWPDSTSHVPSSRDSSGNVTSMIRSGTGFINTAGVGSVDTSVIQSIAQTENGTNTYCADTSGSGNVHACTIPAGISAYATGMVLNYCNVGASATQPTLNVTSGSTVLGAKNIYWGDGVTNPGTGLLASPACYTLTYDATLNSAAGGFKILSGPQQFQVNPQTSTYTATAADFAVCKTITVASGTFTITLPLAGATQPPNGQCINVINYGSGAVTIARNGQLLNGQTSNFVIPAASTVTEPNGVRIVSNQTDFFLQTTMGNFNWGTHSAGITDIAPVVGDSGLILAINPASNIHLTRLFCAVQGTTNVVVNLDKRTEAAIGTDTGNHLLGADLTAVAGGANTSTFANGAGQCSATTSCAIAAHSPVVMTFTSVSGTPTALNCSLDYTID